MASIFKQKTEANDSFASHLPPFPKKKVQLLFVKTSKA